MDPLPRFGNLVRAQRRARGLTQQQLAAHTGLTRTYIGQVERGTKNISLLNILRIARALHVPAATLLEALDLPADLPPSPDP